MIQRMRNVVPIDVTDMSLAGVFNIEVYLEQKATQTELKFDGDQVRVIDDDTLAIEITKEQAMRFSTATVRGQVAFMDADGNPNATKVFYVPVGELIWREGYGD